MRSSSGFFTQVTVIKVTLMFLAVDQTPSPSRILSAVEKLFTETPFRSIPENPFCQAFRTGLALTPQNMTVCPSVLWLPKSPPQNFYGIFLVALDDQEYVNF